MGKAIRVVGLWLPLFFLAMALHESLHALAVMLLGSHPVLVLRPWQLALAPVSITGVHVQPVPALDPTRQALDNLAGPGVAAILLGVLALNLPKGALRLAVIANAFGLCFYAIIETLDVLLDGRLEVGFLTAPEFNYGVPLLIALAVAAIGVGRGRPRSSAQDQSFEASAV
ncbi:MAG TPA: hypothetical protein VJT78_12410 [Candidatus Dormibacteraeota bacterium]|nr:hypothetical protein [Candidatus Dormibacteraeota bacterium]